MMKDVCQLNHQVAARVKWQFLKKHQSEYGWLAVVSNDRGFLITQALIFQFLSGSLNRPPSPKSQTIAIGLKPNLAGLSRLMVDATEFDDHHLIRGHFVVVQRNAQTSGAPTSGGIHMDVKLITAD